MVAIAETPLEGDSPSPYRKPRRRLRRFLRWLVRWLDVRRVRPWWRRQGAPVRAIVVAGILIGSLAPAAMIRQGWHSAEARRGVGMVRGVFTAGSCDWELVGGDLGKHYYTCRGAFDSPSVHLSSTVAHWDVAEGVPTPAYLDGGQVDIPNNRAAAGDLAIWTMLAFLVAALETAVLSPVVAVVRGGPHRMAPSLRPWVVGLLAFPGVIIIGGLSFVGSWVGFGLAS